MSQSDIPLSDHELVFVKEYAKSLNKTKAYLAAYPDAAYSAANTNGPAMCRRPNVAAAIEFELAKRATAAEVEAEAILTKLKDAIERALDAGEFGAAIQGIKLLGQQAGLFNPKKMVEHTGEGGGPIQTRHSVMIYVPDNGRTREAVPLPELRPELAEGPSIPALVAETVDADGD